MTIFKLLAAASLAAVVFPSLYAEPHCPGNVASIRPRFVERAFIIVPVTLNGTGSYDFLVDTGAEITIIDPELASELHSTRLGTAHVTGVGAYSDAEYGRLELLQAGAYSVKNPLILIQDLKWVQQIDGHIRGVLGENFLELFDLLIDYGRGILCLDNTKKMQQSLKGPHIALKPPYSDRDQPLIKPLSIQVQASDLSDQPLLMQLDSGINTAVLFKSGLGLPSVSFLATSRHRGHADEVTEALAILPHQDIKVGTHSFRQITFVTPAGDVKDFRLKQQVDGVLPTALFQRVFISFADRFAILDPW